MNPQTPNPPSSLDLKALEQHFGLGVGILCVLYLLLECLYIARLPLVMDEFQVADHVQRLLEAVPYRDYVPYKNVLGYVLLLPALLVSSEPWLPLMMMKAQIALLTAAGLALSAWALSRQFRRSAVLLGLALLVVMSTWLERSAELRVDGLTALAGLASLCLLLDRRERWAGLAAGVAFLISQKGIYFGVAGGLAALAGCWVEPTRRSLRAPLDFGLGALLPLLLYYGSISLVAQPERLFGASLGNAADMALASNYAIHHFWAQTILRNPYFYGVAFLGLGALHHCRHDPERGESHRRLAIYAGTLLCLALWHKQPWPYFFVILLPTLYVLAVAYFDLEWARSRKSSPRLGAAALALYLFVGLAFPATRIGVALQRSNQMQRQTVEHAAALLEPGEAYLAGLSLVRENPQPGNVLRWLDAGRRARVRAMDETQARELLELLERQAPKLVIENYRLHDLPPWLLAYLDQRYAAWWGPIRLYAPAAPAGNHSMPVRFDGTYRVEAPKGVTPVIQGKARPAGETVELKAGRIPIASTAPFRLRLEPPGPAPSTPGETTELFPSVYSY